MPLPTSPLTTTLSSARSSMRRPSPSQDATAPPLRPPPPSSTPVPAKFCSFPSPNHSPLGCFRNKDGQTNIVRVVIGEGRCAVVASTTDKEPNWYLDSCASKHTAHDRNAFETFLERRSTTEGFNGSVVEIAGFVTVALQVNVGDKVKEVVVRNVNYCPTSQYNLT